MAIEIMSWIFHQPILQGNERLVYLALANNASLEGYCWPSLQTIANNAGITRRSVIRIIKDLVAKGLLVYDCRWEKDENKKIQHRNQTNYYRVCWTEEIRIAEGVQGFYQLYCHPTAKKVVTQSHHPGDTPSPHIVTQSHQGSDTESPRVVTHRHQGSDTESPKSLLNHKREPSTKTPIEPPPPTPQSAPADQAATKEEEALLVAIGDELRSFGIFDKTAEKIVKAMIEKDLTISAVRSIMTDLRAKHPEERAAALLLTRVRETSRTTSHLGYTNIHSEYPMCRCGRVKHKNAMTLDNGQYVCDDCYFQDHPEELEGIA